MQKLRKIPMRMCCGCGEHKEKRELIRVVKAPDGSINVDLTGKMNGRGAYICPRVECLNKAVKSKRLENTFQSPISEEVWKALKEEVSKI